MTKQSRRGLLEIVIGLATSFSSGCLPPYSDFILANEHTFVTTEEGGTYLTMQKLVCQKVSYR